MKTIIYLLMATMVAMMVAAICSCSTVKQPNGTIATSLLGNVILADGTSISHDEANKTVTKLGMTNIITGGVKSLATTTTDYLKNKDGNNVITGSNNNNLTESLDDNAKALELEKLKNQFEIDKLKLTTPIQP